MSEVAFYVILFVISGALGYRGSIRLTRRYRAAIRGDDGFTELERMLFGALVATSWIVTAAATYLGILSIRRLLGFESLVFLAPVSIAISMAVLLIPAGLDYVVEHIARWDEE